MSDLVSRKKIQMIVKYKKKGHNEGHTGGAWKIAYADFITAMMTFFLLMWILNVATEQQKKAIARYFDPFGSSTSQNHKELVVIEGPRPAAGDTAMVKDVASPEFIHAREIPDEGAEKSYEEEKQIKPEHAEEIQKALEQMREAFRNDPLLKALEGSVRIEEVPEGVRLQLLDRDNFSMFQKGRHDVLPHTRELFKKIAQILKPIPYRMSITGHTDAHPFQSKRAYDNWELSSDRAHACRRVLLESGISTDRIDAVVGCADTQLLVPDDPFAPENRRISIVVLYPRG